jgi:hypothetical protein
MSVANDVDRGLGIKKRIAELALELAEIEDRLVKAGLEGDQVELEDPDREGRQWLARGTEQVVPVVFTADLLVQSFANGSVIHGNIVAALGEHPLGNFYRRVSGFAAQFDNGKKFRAHAAEMLGASAPKFISACLRRDKDGTPKSQIRIEWERASAITPARAHDHARDRSESEAASHSLTAARAGHIGKLRSRSPTASWSLTKRGSAAG